MTPRALNHVHGDAAIGHESTASAARQNPTAKHGATYRARRWNEVLASCVRPREANSREFLCFGRAAAHLRALEGGSLRPSAAGALAFRLATDCNVPRATPRPSVRFLLPSCLGGRCLRWRCHSRRRARVRWQRCSRSVDDVNDVNDVTDVASSGSRAVACQRRDSRRHNLAAVIWWPSFDGERGCSRLLSVGTGAAVTHPRPRPRPSSRRQR
jgi:hypothetical protein